MKVHKKKRFGKRKKDLGTFLKGKKSWRKIIRYCRKYLHKYGGYDATFEFDKGSIQIIINSYSGKIRKEKFKGSDLEDEKDD